MTNEIATREYANALLVQGASLMRRAIVEITKTETDQTMLHKLAEIASECAWCEREFGEAEK